MFVPLVFDLGVLFFFLFVFLYTFMGIWLDMSRIYGVWIAVFATHAFAISRQAQVECPRDKDMASPRAFYAWETRNVGYDSPKVLGQIMR